MRNTTVRSIAHEVNTRTRSAEQVAQEAVERATALIAVDRT